MTVRAAGSVGDFNPELVAAITAAVQAFIEGEAGRPSERHPGIPAWRRVAHLGFDYGWRGWRRHD